MAKSIILLLNLIGVIIFELFYGEVVTVKQDFPTNMEINVTDTIVVTISKNELNGFAKLQQDIPNGFNIEVVDSKGGTFSFKDNILKIIWIALPSEKEFQISYAITPTEGVDKTVTFAGKFSYIEENERQNIDFGPSSVTIVATDATLAEDSEVTKAEKNANKKSAKQNKPKSELVAEGDDYLVYREIAQLQDETNKFRVTLIIEKNEINSFGKIEETIPSGFVATEENSNEGFFSFKGNQVKLLWMALPFGESVTASYLIEATSEISGEPEIFGKFSFLKDEETYATNLSASKINTNNLTEIIPTEEIAEEIATETPLEKVIDDAKEEVAMIESEEIVEAPIETPKPEIKEEKLVSNITNIPSPETGISYKVQIAAGHKEVAANYFAKVHAINEPVATEFHEGWRKYTVGKFPIYKAARDKRNEIWAANNKISDAFVTAYNQGNRITVQEALMISKQQWFK